MGGYFRKNEVGGMDWSLFFSHSLYKAAVLRLFKQGVDPPIIKEETGTRVMW